MNIQEIFNSLTQTPTQKSQPVPINIYLPVVDDDWEPVSAIGPSKEGPWICGGAALRWYEGQSVGLSDIDVFFVNEEQFDEVHKRLTSLAQVTPTFQSNNALTFEYSSTGSHWQKSNQWKIQLIRRTFFDSIEDVLGSFDITACQIGMDGDQFAYSKETIRDIHDKVLRIDTDNMKPGVIKRYAKYIAYGYTPVPGLHEAITMNPTTQWEFEFSDDYDDV